MPRRNVSTKQAKKEQEPQKPGKPAKEEPPVDSDDQPTEEQDPGPAETTEDVPVVKAEPITPFKSDEAEESTSNVDPSTTTSASSSRPRRTARKNTLYNNEDYELSATGPLLSGTPSEKIPIPKSARAPVLSRESSTPASRKRAAPIQLSSGKSTKKMEVQEAEAEREEVR
ncbi:hypothetical protein CAEBREN_18902 [Caenorhabditis brenneri]|uniref:Uncharacterized protein n=1 Tax=Caenorhabditis brenneri TaxID=135651 RepID=G0N1X4_CAEBE|nr:hypothetical protein CAEBREN_18902 [Caenorhabditis brenneri]